MVAALALFALATVADAAPYRGREWLNSYYRNPEPERFVASVFDLSRNRYFALPGRAMVGIGFMASVFRQNPDEVDEWLRYCRGLPERERRMVVAALWYAGFPKGEEYLRLYAEAAEQPRMREKLMRVLEGTPSFDDLPVASRSALHLGWGRFLATGDEGQLRRLFEAMPAIPDLTLRDRWWLACTLAEHEAVVAWCRSELPHQPVEVREGLELVLSAAGALAVVVE